MTDAIRRFAVLAAATAALAACDAAPTEVQDPPLAFAAAERIVEESLYDLSGVQFAFACSDDGEELPIDQGELIAIEGQIYEKITLLRDGKGEYHYTLHTMPVGLRGVGVESGEEFRVTERQHQVSNSLELSGSGTYRQELKMVGKDTKRTFWLVTSGFYRIDHDGNTAVTRDRERVVCRAGVSS
jgi:hypothetical protein